MTRIFAIANEKGGVAKTTTALSLGGAWAEAGKKVLLIDLDPQASLTLSIGFSPLDLSHSVTDLLINSISPNSLKKSTSISGLDILPANSDLILAERYLAIRDNYKQLLRSAIRNITTYDAIIIDCPPSLGAITENALTSADFLIIPVVPEYLAVCALRDTTQAVRMIRSKENAHLSYRILFTMVDRRIKTHKMICSKFREKFGKAIFDTEIQVDTRLREASFQGLPITHYVAETRGAKQYRNLAEELDDYI
jgi:chromosome partitioning protein